MPHTLTQMREYIKKKTSGRNSGKTITREQVFRNVSGAMEEKRDAWSNLQNDGEIFERKPSRWAWLGSN